MASMKTPIQAILFDIEGTLISNGALIPGSADAVSYARSRGIEVRFLTNMTGRSCAQIASDLTILGIKVDEFEVLTAVSACVSFLKNAPELTCHLMLPEKIVGLFDGVKRDDNNPDFVVLGDLGESFNYEVLNRIFKMLRNGAELLVFHKNLFWLSSEGEHLDGGAFAIALEAASGKTATVTGKPSSTFFEIALSGLSCDRDNVLIVGDDISTDVAGGIAAAVRTLLVGTGKSAASSVSSQFREDYFLESVAELPQFLSEKCLH